MSWSCSALQCHQYAVGRVTKIKQAPALHDVNTTQTAQALVLCCCGLLHLLLLPGPQVNQALEVYPQHADSLELKSQLRLQLNAV
jgi:hypothetical protein